MSKKGKNRKSWQKHLENDKDISVTEQPEELRCISDKIDAINDKLFGPAKVILAPLITTMLILAAFIAVIFAISSSNACTEASYQSSGLDYIELYEVETAARADGTLDISYHIVWKVLDGYSQGPLTWVKLGLANKNCELIGFDGAASSCNIDGCYANVTLDGEYDTDDIADFGIKIHQRSMLCSDKKDAGRLYYRFTPGWFNGIEVGHYRYSWKYSGGILSADNDTRDGDMLVWEGSFAPGERREMTLYYDADSFNDPMTVKYSPSKAGSGVPSDHDDSIAIVVVVAVVAFLMCSLIKSVGAYSSGSGFRTGGVSHVLMGSRGYHGGGHRGCACAGCACACACAGGGRAGCSVKDYYEPERDG